MNLIEKLGGYEKAKRELKLKLENSMFQCCRAITAEMISDALLEYRREHGVFEVADKVVYPHLSHERLFSVRYVHGDQIVVYELWDEMGAKTFTEFHPYSDIRHATDEEIKAGHRIDHGTPTNEGADNFSHFDHCSDIRNHISPNTVVIER